MPTKIPGRHCAICRKPGGSGSTTALRLLGFAIPDGQIGYAHGPCIIAARKRAAKKAVEGAPEREAIAGAAFFAVHLRRGPGFVIHEEPFASLAIADARALLIEAEHKPRPCMIYAVTPEGRSYLVPADMRLAARNPERKP